MPSEIRVTEIRNLQPVNKTGATRAYVDVVFNNDLCVKGFRVVETERDGEANLWVSAPSRSYESKKTGKVEWNDIAFVTKSGKEGGLWQDICDAILAHYNENVSATPTP